MAEDLLGVGEIVGKFLDKLESVVGWIAAPYQVKRLARANAAAEAITAEGKVRALGIERRAMARLVAQETRNQENMEVIAWMATEHLKDRARPADMDNDWIAKFFDRCRLVSDNEMRELWARVLAGEANDPGAYSKRTIAMLESMDREDATMFSKLCVFRWRMRLDDPKVQLVISTEAWRDGNINRLGITFETLAHLDSIGLVKFDPQGRFCEDALPATFVAEYHDRRHRVDVGRPGDIALGCVLLTKTGQELQRVCGSVFDDVAYQHVLQFWRAFGRATVTEIGPDEPSAGVNEHAG